MKILATISLVWLLGAFVPVWGHGDLHGQIEETTRQMEKDRGNGGLFLKRGELHRAHGEWDAATADYEQAMALDPKLTVVDLARGKMFLEANWPLSAKVALDRFLTRQTNHVDALSVRARVLSRLGQRLAAVRDFNQAIAFSKEPNVELYFERAQVLTQEGGAYLEEALKGLDEGMRKLGPLVTLQLYAIDTEVKLNRFDPALKRLEEIAAKSPRKETWLARRGEILQQAGRGDEARETFKAALKAISELPAARRNVPAIGELEKRIRAALEAPAPAGKSGVKKD